MGFALLGAVAGIAVAFGVMILGFAVLWLWVFGDDTWPDQARTGLLVVSYGVGLAVFVGITWAGIQSRKR